LRDRVGGIIFVAVVLAYPFLASDLAGLPRKKRMARFRAARFTAPNPKEVRPEP
jgi:hypothetical protein